MKITKAVLMTVMASLMAPLTAQALGSSAVQAIGDKERTILFPTRAMVDFGKAAAESNCFSCHGADGISDTEGKPHLAGQRTVYLYRVLKAFQSGDRPDESNSHNDFLNDDALLATAVYYSSLAPVQLPVASEPDESAEVAPEPEEDPFFGIRGSMRKCIKCHGETGNATRSGMPSLTGQDPEYFLTSMMGYIDGSRTHKLMKKLVSKLDEATIRQMGVYYAVQEPVQTKNQGEGDVNVGRRLAADCESCHGGDGNASKPKMPTLAGQDPKYFIKAMSHYNDGKRKHQKMFEAIEHLNEQDIIDLATYFAAEQPHRRDVRAPLKSTEWIARCERCHGIDGNSSDPRFPMLAGQDEGYLRNALQSYASGVRSSTTMLAMSDPLSAIDVERIAAYFAAQQPKAVVYLQLPCGDEHSK